MPIKSVRFLLTVALITLAGTAVRAQKPLVIAAQGSFSVGGIRITQPGNFDLSNALKPDGQTFHGDHVYAFYQVPVKAHRYPLVFLHGAGQSKRTWETTPDGREGFQNIFFKAWLWCLFTGSAPAWRSW